MQIKVLSCRLPPRLLYRRACPLSFNRERAGGRMDGWRHTDTYTHTRTHTPKGACAGIQSIIFYVKRSGWVKKMRTHTHRRAFPIFPPFFPSLPPPPFSFNGLHLSIVVGMYSIASALSPFSSLPLPPLSTFLAVKSHLKSHHNTTPKNPPTYPRRVLKCFSSPSPPNARSTRFPPPTTPPTHLAPTLEAIEGFGPFPTGSSGWN